MFIEALDKGLVENSLDNFYLISRVLSKSEAEFDVFDACFCTFLRRRNTR